MYLEEQHNKDLIQIIESKSNKSELCDICHGSGTQGDGLCSSCNGKGLI
jgi:DnaJ-class molecular chaperone